jgi:hypothetical protein
MKKNNQKGQALIELIIFLPLMFIFYSMISGFANAINGSINQQKIARSYFYYRVQNNSTIPKPDAEGTFANWQLFGMFFIGWKDYFENQKPVAPCYKLTVPLQANSSDKCETEYTTPSSLYIRVQTAYGVCGSTYQKSGNTAVPVPDFLGGSFQTLVDKGSCLIIQ